MPECILREGYRGTCSASTSWGHLNTMNEEDKILQVSKTGLGVDIDETLSWTVGYWVEELQKLFGNPENLSVKEIVDKYGYTQNIPYWQSEEALKWMENKRNSSDFQEGLPLIEDSNHFLNKINKIVPIAAYITIRPERIEEATRRWLRKHGFPEAPIVFRPNEISVEDGNKWKVKIIEKLYPKIIGFIDDSPYVVSLLPKNYKGTVFYYNKVPVKSKLNVIQCKSWKSIYEEVKRNFKREE